MAEGKHQKKPKRATDKRRQYGAYMPGRVEGGGADGGNGAARSSAIFNDRRKKVGEGKRAS